MNDLPIQVIEGEPFPAMGEGFCNTLEKLTARLNFVTMGAGWYGDEDNIISIVFKLVPQDYLCRHAIDKELQANAVADDVLYFFHSGSQQVECYVEITTAEKLIIANNSTLTYRLIEGKLLKVLAILAGDLDLAAL